MVTHLNLPHENILLRSKYNVTAFFYDILDYPWERVYKTWRPQIIGDLRGKVLEAGIGTGRNLSHYHESVQLTALDLSDAMLRKANKRAHHARCDIDFIHDDATIMHLVESDTYDWVVSTFMCCVMPDRIQPLAIEQFSRVLKPGGRFRLLEMIYSKNENIRKRQERFASFVDFVYGARFDRKTVELIEQNPTLEITSKKFLKDDVYLLIEGRKK